MKSALFLACEQSTHAWAVAVLQAGRPAVCVGCLLLSVKMWNVDGRRLGPLKQAPPLI